MVPSVPVHVVGLVEETVPAVGVGGVSKTCTLMVAGDEVQPFDWAVTVILYVPVATGTMVVEEVADETNPAFAEEADQL